MEGLTISVLNYQGKEVLQPCLDSILAQEIPKPYDIQIIDNASTDGSAEEAFSKYQEVKYLIHADNKYQFITGLNESFKQARYEDVLFLSNDLILEKGSLSTLVDTYRRLDKVIVQPVFKTLEGKIQNAGMDMLWPGYGVSNKILGEFGPFFETEVFATTAFIMSKSAFKEIGLFDERFAPAFMEDVDYSIRATGLGYRLLVDKTSSMRHYTSHSFSKRYSHRQIEGFYHQNRIKLIEKHHRGLQRIIRRTAMNFLDLAMYSARYISEKSLQVVAKWRSPKNEGK